MLADSNPINVNDMEPFAGVSAVRPAEVQLHVRRSGRLRILIPVEVDINALLTNQYSNQRFVGVAQPRYAMNNYNNNNNNNNNNVPIMAQRTDRPIYYRPQNALPMNKQFPVYRPGFPDIQQNRPEWPQLSPVQRVGNTIVI